MQDRLRERKYAGSKNEYSDPGLTVLKIPPIITQRDKFTAPF